MGLAFPLGCFGSHTASGLKLEGLCNKVDLEGQDQSSQWVLIVIAKEWIVLQSETTGLWERLWL